MKLFDEIYDYLSHRNQQLTNVVKPKKKKRQQCIDKMEIKIDGENLSKDKTTTRVTHSK